MHIVPPRFCCEAEETEKYIGTDDDEPARHLLSHDSRVAEAPNRRGELINMRPIEVKVGPAAVGKDATRGVEVKEICGNRSRTQKLNRCEGHEAEVAIHGECRILARQELPELSAFLVECTQR